MKPIKQKLPAEILSQHIAALGKTGSGKTSTAKLAVEQAYDAGARVCIIDPVKSDWWGLTSSADGQRPGLPFSILGGPRGHVALHAEAGRAIAELVAGGALKHSILDMSDFPPGGSSKFFIEFAQVLMQKMTGVLHLVIEEAHEFAPKERSGIGQENMAIHYAKKLATAGRSKGIRLILATQRVQALHNALLGSCETLIAHRLTAPADQKPIVDWLKANTSKEVVQQVSSTLSSLKTGTAWVCSGEAQIFQQMAFEKFRTYDNTATPTHDGHAKEVQTAAVDLEQLRALIGHAVDEAAANDPKKLKARIAELEQENVIVNRSMLRSEEHDEYQARITELREALQFKLELHNEQVEQLKTLNGINTNLRAQFNEIAPLLDRIQSIVSSCQNMFELPNAQQGDTKRKDEFRRIIHRASQDYSTTVVRHESMPKKAAEISTSLTQYQSDLLRTLIDRHPLSLSKGQLAALAQKSVKSSAFLPNVRDLIDAGLAERNGSGYSATPKGLKALPGYQSAPKSGRAALDYWIGKLNAYESGLLQIYAQNRARQLTIEELAKMSNRSLTSSAFRPALRNLVCLQLLNRSGNHYQLAEVLK